MQGFYQTGHFFWGEQAPRAVAVPTSLEETLSTIEASGHRSWLHSRITLKISKNAEQTVPLNGIGKTAASRRKHKGIFSSSGGRQRLFAQDPENANQKEK